MRLTLAYLLDAIAWAYAPDGLPPGGLVVLARQEQGPAQAVHARIGCARVLLVPGTNEVADAIRARAPAVARYAAGAPTSGREVGARTLLDLDAVPIDWDGYRVHRGAARHASRLLSWEPWLGAADLIVGHSLGGASALLAGRRRQVRTVAVAPFRPYRGQAPADGSLSLVNPTDAVPSYPGGGWSLPGCVLAVPPSRGGVLEAHSPAAYVAQLGALGRADLGPFVAAVQP